MHVDQERLFKLAMSWRIAYGIGRILLALAVLEVIGRPVIDVVDIVMGHELVEDPHDLLYTFVATFLSNHPLEITYFIAGYLIFWGAVDIILSYNLILHRVWAFPFSILLIACFLLYEVVRYTHTHSVILLGVMGVDMIILFLTYREYRRMRSIEPPTPGAVT